MIKWLENHYSAFETNEKLSATLLDFIQTSVANGSMTNADANWIKNLIKIKVSAFCSITLAIILSFFLVQVWNEEPCGGSRSGDDACVANHLQGHLLRFHGPCPH